MGKEGVSGNKIAATYIGTIVGAGFATGQEVLQFFLKFGLMGLVGIITVTIMFIVFGYIVMDMSQNLKAASHLKIIKYSGGNFLGIIIDFIIIFFLFGALTAMIAGSGALFIQQFNLSSLLGNIVMALLTALTVLSGIGGVINSISIIVPFLLAAIVTTSVYSIINTPPNLNVIAPELAETGLVINWFMAAVLYVSYNLIIAVGVLSSLGVKAENKKVIRNGAVLGGLGLGAGAVMIYIALSGNISKVAGLEIPMLYIAGNSLFLQSIYTFVLAAAIYTTAVGSLYGFVTRIIDIQKHPSKGRIVVITASIAALLSSQFGFSNLVIYLYPLVGYGGILLLISLLYGTVKQLFQGNS